MILTTGTRLGPYEVVAPLGAGGMGEVWRARDTRLDRSVAIKLLPVEFAGDAQLRARLEREARTISQLNHPHICTLYDVGREDGREYLVMELVEGETLADRLTRGPLPLRDVIRHGTEIAAALDRAHAAGIVHRDLKPGNIMLTTTGAKLLDFGLAKSAGPALGGRDTDGETVKKPITEQGMILGTYQYMAPEQIEGLEADHRTDIFALGAVLYEMATGRRAFEGKSRTSIIAAIIDRDPPPIASVQPLAPRSFERVVQTCLAKDPAARWQSAGDVRIALQWAGEEGDAAPRARDRRGWIAAAILATIAALAGAGWIASRSAAREQRPIRTSINAADGTTFQFFLEGSPPELSPDGRKIVFGAGSSGGERFGASGSSALWVRDLDSPVARQLKGTEGATHPFWSPDGRQVAFYSDGALKKVDVAGGAVVSLCATEPIRGGAWNRDGTILFGRIGISIAAVPAAGGTPADVTVLDEKARDPSHRWPFFLPDGKHFLYLVGPNTAGEEHDAIWVASLDGKVRKPLIRASSNAAFLDGSILFVRDGILTAQRFDTRKLEVTGDPIPLAEQRVEFDDITARAFFSVSRNGTLLLQTGEGAGPGELRWFDRTGKALESAGKPQRHGQISISPDGRYVAYSIVPRQNIWMYDLARNVNSRVTFASAREVAPVWSPDGTRLVFSSDRDANVANLWIKDLRTGAEEQLVVSESNKIATDWSTDGQFLFYTDQRRGWTRADIHYYSFAEKKSYPYLVTPFNEATARMSPDGKWVAYQSSESPPWQVYIAPFPPTGAKWQVSANVGVRPSWRADGKELFFHARGVLHSVAIRLG
ncbi:MAG TPA: protein kinase, partial [Thermoanaerobaculia bacterium]|nr:protein kinase [Thermoanaerobaculia bacterium]